jgi:hypothetical protein
MAKEAWREAWEAKFDKQVDAELTKHTERLAQIDYKISIVHKQVTYLAEADKALNKRDSIDKILNKAISLDMDDTMLVKSVGMNTAELVNFRMKYAEVAMQWLTMAHELNSELD